MLWGSLMLAPVVAIRGLLTISANFVEITREETIAAVLMGNTLDCCCCFQADVGAAPGVTDMLLPRRWRDPPPDAPVDKRWYHGAIDGEVAKSRLKSVSSDNGVYLVYDNPRFYGSYILLVMLNGNCERVNINKKRDGTYILGRDGPRVKSHASVRKLIKYHRGLLGKPIPLPNNRSVTLWDYVYKRSEHKRSVPIN